LLGISRKVPILPSHKTNIEYLEHCRVVAADDRLVYVRKKESVDQHFSIPYGNTALLLLGPGTSLTQQAARLAASQGMLVAFTAGGATPIYLAAQNEYREPLHMQNWYSMWLNEDSRLEAAKKFQKIRVSNIRSAWREIEGVPEVNEGTIAAFELRAHLARELTSQSDYTANLRRILSDRLGERPKPMTSPTRSSTTETILLTV
jgi:CRISP-associated protein Cas1